MKWNEIFEYKDGIIYWKINSGANKVKGKSAGAYHNGYLRTKVNGKKYLNHRIIYEMHFGYCPHMLDHIDRNRMNNRIENLRPATRELNAYNRETWKIRDLPRGIYKLGNSYIAKIGKIYLGSFKEINDAVNCRNINMKYEII